MGWRRVGTVSIRAADQLVTVGPVSIQSTDRVEVRIRQVSPETTSVFRAGLFYVLSGNGRVLGSHKFWGHREGEDYVLGGDGYSSQDVSGVLMIEPRYVNRQALKSPSISPWVLDVSYREPGDLPADRVQAPGFVDRLNKLLGLTLSGSSGRITF